MRNHGFHAKRVYPTLLLGGNMPTPSNKPNPSMQLPPPLFFLAALFFGYSVDRVIRWQLPAWALNNYLAIFFATTAVLVIASALWAFRRHNTTVIPYRKARALLTSGPFRYSRNPLYLSFALLHLACALAQRSPGMLLTLPFAVWAIQQYVITQEEQILATLFGEQWQQYRRRVRRWL